MADVVDLANEQAERILCSARRYRAPEGPTSNGCCLYCGEPLPSGERWCDADCRDEWEYERSLKHGPQRLG